MKNRGYHDVGGLPGEAIDRTVRPMAFWEKRMEAMRDCLSRTVPPVMTVDEMRQAIESMGAETYDALGFYERKAAAVRQVLIEKNVLEPDELAECEARIRVGREAAVRAQPERFDHRHDHRHDHPGAGNDDAVASPFDVISEAVQLCLVAKGVLSAETVRLMIERMENAGPVLGARIVARAWADPIFEKRLLADAKDALLEIGVTPLETKFVVLANTADIHNVIVCTLCSCYPRSILGAPPAWYVSKAYRSRVVREPRAVLADFGTRIGDDVEVRVHDSTADLRYMVLPLRPTGTDGWDEDRLRRLVNRDSLIGVTTAIQPETQAGRR